MGNLINLASYRSRSRKAYLAKHGQRIDRFVERFVKMHLDVDFRQLAEDYVAGRGDAARAAWDYVHFREVLADALNEAFGEALYRELEVQAWFNNRLITRDEIIDRCLSSYIMDRCQYALV